MQRISEVIEIIEKTGDKCIILKETSSFVVMKFEDYKKLLLEQESLLKSRGFSASIKDFEIPEEDRYYPEPLED